MHFLYDIYVFIIVLDERVFLFGYLYLLFLFQQTVGIPIGPSCALLFVDMICFNRNLQFLNHVIIIKTNVLLPQTLMTLDHFSYSVHVLWFSWSERLLNHLAFKYFFFERIWWRLFHKHVMCTKFDIYAFLFSFTVIRLKWSTFRARLSQEKRKEARRI